MGGLDACARRLTFAVALLLRLLVAARQLPQRGLRQVLLLLLLCTGHGLLLLLLLLLVVFVHGDLVGWVGWGE